MSDITLTEAESEALAQPVRPTRRRCRMRCPATHDTHACCRTQRHSMPHMAHDGTQWDQHGVRQARGNDPMKGQVK